VRKSGARSHSAGEAAGDATAAAESSVSTEAAAMAATKTTVTSAAALRPHGYGQEERERRDGHQATHTRLL
jgi:D-aminopeptidase